jgi:hypothetical protein
VRYFVGHDCGTVINLKIVRGMTMGGIAHGIGSGEALPAPGAVPISGTIKLDLRTVSRYVIAS